jgi:hypothetical protein
MVGYLACIKKTAKQPSILVIDIDARQPRYVTIRVFFSFVPDVFFSITERCWDDVDLGRERTLKRLNQGTDGKEKNGP